VAWRAALDSEPALVLATTLHTLGAIGVIAALGTHIAWYRRLRAGEDSVTLDRWTFWLTMNSVLANLVGGFMRTYLPGHPSITDFAASPWVQVMTLKHMFIFTALGGLIFLHHKVAPDLRRAAARKRLNGPTPLGHAVGIWIIVTGVVVASVLGAMAQITPLGDEFEGLHGQEEHTTPSGRTVRYTNVTGSLTSIPPALTQESQGTFDVAADSVVLDATLTWSDAAASLGLWIEAQGDGAGDPGGFFAGSGGRAEAHVDGPVVGDWRYRVTGQNAVNVGWQLSIRSATVTGHEVLLSETVTVPPGSFFEINTEMDAGASFRWDWTASARVHFDVHSHFDGEVQYHVEKQTTSDAGSFRNERAGGYSLLWANEGGAPVTLQYRVWGAFEVDSYFPPR
jgi:hypothetical protein